MVAAHFGSTSHSICSLPASELCCRDLAQPSWLAQVLMAGFCRHRKSAQHGLSVRVLCPTRAPKARPLHLHRTCLCGELD